VTTKLALESLEERTLLSFGFGAAFSVGGTGFDYGNSIAKDAAGDTYLAGEYSGPGVNFNPNGQPIYLNGGQWEGYAAMYRPDMTLAWATDLGPAVGAQLAVQGTNVYVAYPAWTGSTAGPYNILATKLNATTGAIQWSTSLASGVASEYRAIAVGSSGNAYVAAGTASGQAAVTKLDPLGNILWSATTTGGSAVATGIAVDSSENVFETGGYTGPVTFGPGHSLTSMSGTQDAFVWKLNSAGVSVWAGSMGSIGDDIGYAITVDSGGNAILTGGWGYSQTVSTKTMSRNNDFDPGAGVLRLTDQGTNGHDIFIVKLAPNPDGSMQLSWTKDIGGSKTVLAPGDWGRGITVDSSGNVYTTGSFSDSVNFNPGAGTYVLNSAGGRDIFVSKLDANGNFVAAADMGGTAYDDGASLAVDSSGNVWTTGGFRGTADFDPTAGTYYLTENGSPTDLAFDIFVSKLTQTGPLAPAAMAPATAAAPSLSPMLIQTLPTGSKPTFPIPGERNEEGPPFAPNETVFAEKAQDMPTASAAVDVFFANLSRGGVKEKATNLGVLEFANNVDFLLVA
jgi:hypothetical protein